MCGIVGKSVLVHTTAIEAYRYGHSTLDAHVHHRAHACDAPVEQPWSRRDLVGRRPVSGTANSMAAIAWNQHCQSP